MTRISLRKATCFVLQGDGPFQTATKLDDGDTLTHPNGIVDGQKNISISNIIQAADVAVDTNVTDVTFATDEFSSYDDGRDLDCPTQGFASIPEAIEDIRQGKVGYCGIIA